MKTYIVKLRSDEVLNVKAENYSLDAMGFAEFTALNGDKVASFSNVWCIEEDSSTLRPHSG